MRTLTGPPADRADGFAAVVAIGSRVPGGFS